MIEVYISNIEFRAFIFTSIESYLLLVKMKIEMDGFMQKYVICGGLIRVI